MKADARLVCLAVLLSAVASFAVVDHNPKNNGTTLTRNAMGSAYEASYHNPALLGVERMPKGGALLIPFTNYGLGLWSDKLVLRPYKGLITGDLDSLVIAAIISDELDRSFNLAGKTPSEVSEILTDELKDGISIYSGFRTSLLSFAHSHVAFDVTTRFDQEVHVPGAPLLMAFSETDGLLRGNTLDLTDLYQEAIWATDFSFQLGLPLSIPALHDLFRLRYGAGGVGVKYVMGHSIFKATAPKGKLAYNAATNALDVDAEILIQQAGTGIHGDWKFRDGGPFADGLPVSGHGIGVEAGGILYDDKGSLTINIQNLGVLFWMNDVQEVTYKVKKSDLDIYDIIDGVDEIGGTDQANYRIFDRTEDEYLSDHNDVFKESNGFVTVLPISLNIGYAYTWDFVKAQKQGLRLLAENAYLTANYEQQLTKGPGRSFIPRLSLGGEAGTLRGFVPVRLGFILGGPEKWASAFGMGFNFRYFSIHASYKAVGNLALIPKRGMELAGGLNFNWGMIIDSDKDGISDRDDGCPFKPEDKDKWQDEDGCPEPDNDNDGLLDENDKCPNQAEDKDGFEDEDGCPDYDNDGDGITDSLDKCPMEPEDKDNFNDDDGCPDLDNDGDGVKDADDKCPVLPEDIDSYEDEDGCPDYDNDKDGIPDSLDQCIFDPETYNGYKDDDGCPDTLAKPTEKETKELYTKLSNINFKTGSAELTSSSFTSLNFIVGFLKQYPHLRYEIQGHTDSQGDDEYNILLSAARAASVRGYLLMQGVPDDRLIAIGYGETRPIADNNTAEGRAQNRRVEFKTIDTNDDYDILKRQEMLFRERIRDAKIKGAQY